MYKPTLLLSPSPYLIAFTIFYHIVASEISIKPVDFDGLIMPCYQATGQQVPRAHTIDNFIALVSKIEAANPRLASDVDQLIKTLLSRFRMDNYYYDTRMRAPVDDTNLRTNNIIPAIFQAGFQQDQSFLSAAHVFPEHYLSQDEKCSMYFMLSHFIDKTAPNSLASSPVVQLSMPQSGIRPPSLQAAGVATYPAVSAENAYTSGAAGPRYSGPSPSYGSPVTRNMNSFGQGIDNQPDYTGRNPYGMNVPQPSSQLNVNYNNLRQTGQYAGTTMSNTRYQAPYIDGQSSRSRDDSNKMAIENGVVSVGSQENAAIVLNRVLLGILAANMPKQTVRQLASSVFTTPYLAESRSMSEREIDPLFAVTLADLWAVSARTKPGKPIDIRALSDGGHWNSTMCPVNFRLEQTSSKRFTTAELLGGLDGFNLGILRRRLTELRRNIRLSEMLRMYYSKNGFRPQIPDVGVCNRGAQLNSQLDQLEMQAENYLRLYEFNVPMTDSVVQTSIRKLEAFRDMARQAGAQQVPPEICSESDLNDLYPTGGRLGEQCEIARTDLVTVLDTSPQANHAYMNLVVSKLAQKLGLSQEGNSLTVLTNQQDSTGRGGVYGLNVIVSNSTNTAEIGCALVYDSTQTFSGSPVTDPSILLGVFEQALINLDNEYLVRQTYGPVAMPSGANRPLPPSGSPYASSSSLSYGQDVNSYSMQRRASGSSVDSTGGSKVIVFFNYGGPLKPNRIASMGTNWQGSSSSLDQNTYKFQESKRYLRENFRSAAIIAVSSNREDVVDLVFEPDRDIFTDIPPGASSLSASFDAPGYGALNDPSTLSALRDPAEQLAQRLMHRMCTVPAVFQYPLCFRYPSDVTKAVGYITPGRKQYWMMSPKTFFASQYVRLAFRVEGGRLRVCFGRMPNPDETALRSGQQTQYQQTNTISFSPTTSGNPSGGVSQQSQQQLQQQQQQPSSSDYYTGMNYGVCKDVSPGQEIDFLVSDPCYKTSIAECQPFYFVIKEIAPGESDPNYMCRDPGCKRFDQVKFTLTHSGISCSSAFKTAVANWYLIIISIIFATFSLQGQSFSSINLAGRKLASGLKQATLKATSISAVSMVALFTTLCNVQSTQAQQAGVYDFGQNRYGEKRGNLTPSEVAAIILLIMTILLALALTAGLCYYVTKRSKRDGMQQVPREGF